MSEMPERPKWPSSYEELVDLAASTPPDERESARERREREIVAEAARRSRENWLAYARRVSDLGDRFAERTFENYRVPPGDAQALAIAMQQVEDLKQGIWPYGAFGNGKTHLGAATINALMELGTPAAFATAQGLLDRIKASYDRAGNVRDGEHDIVQALTKVPYLFLDDIDKVVLTEWSAQRLYVLINGRYEAKRGIGLSSNLSPADLRNQWTARLQRQNDAELLRALVGSIFDRFIEMTRIFEVRGDSQRGVA